MLIGGIACPAAGAAYTAVDIVWAKCHDGKSISTSAELYFSSE